MLTARRLSRSGRDRLIGLDPAVELAFALDIQHERSPALCGGCIAGLLELVRVEPTDHLLSATGPEQVIVARELQMMGRVAGIDEAIFAALGLVDGQAAARLLEWKQLGRGMIRARLAEGGIIWPAHARRVPHAAEMIEHRIVGVGLTVPDALIAPIHRRLDHRIIVRRGRIGIAHRRMEGAGDVVPGSRIGNSSVLSSGAP